MEDEQFAKNTTGLVCVHFFHANVLHGKDFIIVVWLPFKERMLFIYPDLAVVH
jgi:hypothetical protein